MLPVRYVVNTAGVWILAFVEGLGQFLDKCRRHLAECEVKGVKQLTAQHGELKLRLPPAARCTHFEILFLNLQHRILHIPVLLECQIDCLIEGKHGRLSLGVRRLILRG